MTRHSSHSHIIMLHETIQQFLRKDAVERFLRYVRIDTTSDEHSGKNPSSEIQRDLGKVLKQELEALGLTNVEFDEHCYVYATLPASAGVTAPPITFCSHLDTTESEPGKNVVPVVHQQYDGGVMTYPDNPELTLSPSDSSELSEFIGENIITASGKTLLGADNKAGIAEIMAALAAFVRFKELPHPELRIVFTPDEEIGAGVAKIRMEKLGKFGYTLDGGMVGELEDECFDAVGASIVFHGRNMHPGVSKNRMINAGEIAARFVAALPEYETPEHTEIREGFFHVKSIKGDETLAETSMILRDFDAKINDRRVALLQTMIQLFEQRYPGVHIELKVKEQYDNMRDVLQNYPDVTEKARLAIEAAGVKVIRKAIRGGTDGARMCFMGMPTPNLFTAGMLAHSKKEWVPEIGLQKAAETIVHLCRLWAEEKK